jgi:hypothetical protein
MIREGYALAQRYGLHRAQLEADVHLLALSCYQQDVDLARQVLPRCESHAKHVKVPLYQKRLTELVAAARALTRAR